MPVGFIHQNICRKLVVKGDNCSVSSWTWLNCAILTDAFISLDRLHLMFLYHLSFCSTAALFGPCVLGCSVMSFKTSELWLALFFSACHCARKIKNGKRCTSCNLVHSECHFPRLLPTCASHFREYYWRSYLHAVWAELLLVSTGKIFFFLERFLFVHSKNEAIKNVLQYITHYIPPCP